MDSAQPAASASAGASNHVVPQDDRRDSYNRQSLGRALNAHVKQARVLMVGAGGIGCELLKDLALTGFAEIHVVDLDTIDLSNLNRQFLFRHEHIRRSKALVAKDAAQKFNPNVKIVAYHANIKDPQFNVEWFRSFKLAFNALDNVDARRHVNRMCLAGDVPLIDAGTTGFQGQVQVIKKGVTACYDCTPRPAPKSFPVCTIRSTPSQPIHCIVWGKSYLLSEMFGASEDESAFDHSEDQENAKEIEELKRESEALKKIRQSVGTEEFPELLFNKVFNTDIERLRSMADLWKTRRPPEPLDYQTLLGQAAEALASKEAILRADLTPWSLEENLVVFIDSLNRLSKRVLEMKGAQGDGGPDPVITFDKDDNDTLDFVAASANIRSTLFGIERKSKFDIKEMAGNIIPAIATTNAIVAGLCVLQAFRVLRGEFNQVKEVFITPFNTSRLLAPDKLRQPNPDCPVCSVYQTGAVVDLSRATLNDLVEDFVRMELGFGDREFVVNNDIGILYDADETDNLTKKLSDLGITKDSFVTIIDDDDEEPFVNVVINIQEANEPQTNDKPIKAVSSDKVDIPRKPKKPTIAQSNGVNGKHDRDDDVVVATLPSKRPRDDDAETPSAKKARTIAPVSVDNSDAIVVVDDNAGGAIVIDDD